MKAPKEPSREDCCDSGCNPCIFDVYEKQLRLYKQYIQSGGEASINKRENVISQLEYTAFCVIRNINICSQHRLLLFKQSIPKVEKTMYWEAGEHLLVKYQSDKATCSRAYTPIKLDQQDEEYDFAIIVKRYETGLVSKFLCDLKKGEVCYWRGPYGHYQLDCKKYTRLIMIAQGTGIAPLFSIIKQILSDGENMTRITLFYCCRSMDTILLRNELFSFSSYWNFAYMIYISNNGEMGMKKYNEPITQNRLTETSILELQPFTDTDQFLLCGSDEFMLCYSQILEVKIPGANIVRF